MDVITLRSIFTVACLCVFVGIVAWAFSRRNKAQFRSEEHTSELQSH